MQHWQDLMLKGNRCYMEENWQHAEFYFREAEDVLNAQWFANQKCDELLMAWVCANHNLATLFETTGHYQEALKFLLQPHQRVSRIVRAKTSCNSLKTIAIQAMHKTLEPINLFKKNTTFAKNASMHYFRFRQKIRIERQLFIKEKHHAFSMGKKTR